MKYFVEKIKDLFMHRVVLATSLSKGFLLSLAAVAAVSLALFSIALVAGLLGLELKDALESAGIGVDSLWVVSIWTVLLAAGGFLTTGDESNFVEIQFAPTLLSVLLAIVIFKIARTQVTLTRRPLAATVSSIAIGFGFALGLAVLGWLAQGLLSVQPPTFASLVTVGFLTSLVGLIASSRDAEGRAFSARTSWVLSTSGQFLAMVAIATFALIILALTYFAIEPDFANSSPTLPEVELTGLESLQIALAVIGVLLFAPTIFFTAIMALSGTSFGFSVPGEIASQISGLANLNLGSELSTSLFSWLGLWIIPLALILVAGPALIAGARATRKLSYDVGRGWDFAVLGLFVFVLLMALHHLSELRVAAYSVSEEVTEEVGVLSAGTSLLAVAPWLILGSIGIYLSSKHWSLFVAGSFPRIVWGVSPKALTTQRTLAMKLTGRIATTLVIGAMVAAIGIVSTERVVAMVDSPESRAKALVSSLSTESIAEFKKQYTKTGNGATWFEDAILIAGLPTSEIRPSYSTSNLNDRDWTVGDLDAVTVATWASEAGTASAKISFTHELRQDFFIDRAIFSPRMEPSRLTLSFESTLKTMIPEKDREILVNRIKAPEGEHMMLPGSYKVDFTGYQLIAPFQQTVFSSAEMPKQVVEVPPLINFPGDSEERLRNQALSQSDSCLSAAGWDLACLGVTSSKAGSGAETTEASPERFYDFVDRGLTVNSVECESTEFKLLRADRLRVTAGCSVDVSFNREYFRAASVRRCSLSFFGFCFRFQNLTVRGSSIGEYAYTNRVERTSSLTAVLKGNDLVVEANK